MGVFRQALTGHDTMLHISPEDPRSPEALELLAALQPELAERYDEPRPNASRRKVERTPFSVFVIAWFGEEATGCGALAPPDKGMAEARHLYVRPKRRHCGIGREIPKTLEAHALRSGISCLRLESGSRQPEATAFYRGAGFQPIDPDGPRVAGARSQWLEKHLSPARPKKARMPA